MKQYLSVFTNRRIAVTLLLGFSSGLPLPLVTGTLDAWMVKEGVSLATVGFFSLAQVPYSLKFLWSPFLDRFSLPFMGRRTGWILVSQVLLAFSIVILGWCDPQSQLVWLAGVAVLVAFLSASQDIVVDAYRAEVLREKELGAGAAVAVLGARLALLLAGAGALILSDHMAWNYVYALMAACLMVGVLATLFAPQPEVLPKQPASIMEAVVNPFVEFFRRPGAWSILLFIVCYKLGDAVAGKMTTPFLIKLAFSNTDIGTVNKGFGMIVTIFGALFGGGLISKIGIPSALWVFGILQALSNLAFIALAQLGHNYPMMVACIGIENICGGMGTAAFVAFLMSLTNKEFTATQYALLTAVMSLTRMLAGAGAGVLAESVGWTWFFVLSTIAALPGLALLVVMRRLVGEASRARNA